METNKQTKISPRSKSCPPLNILTPDFRTEMENFNLNGFWLLRRPHLVLLPPGMSRNSHRPHLFTLFRLLLRWHGHPIQSAVFPHSLHCSLPPDLPYFSSWTVITSSAFFSCTLYHMNCKLFKGRNGSLFVHCATPVLRIVPEIEQVLDD